MEFNVGQVAVQPAIVEGRLNSLGAIRIGDTKLRNTQVRFLPWFDTFEGDVFRVFRFVSLERRGEETVLHTEAESDPDTLFRERRDVSGDVCLRETSWDSEPLTAEFRIVFAPAEERVDGRVFTGLKYWFEGDAPVGVHRLADRQTWALGGALDEVNLVCRNLFALPRTRITRDSAYSTVGLDKWSGLLPGNLWARWSLLPSFDMQYGAAGVLLGWFDRVSLIRTVLESLPGEDYVRCVDLHYFEQTREFRTNPKTILWCPDVLDHTDALNLWTRVQDREQAKVRAQFALREEPPAPIVFSLNCWQDYHVDTTYEKAIDVCAEFGGDYVFIDPVWENGETFRRELAGLIPEDRRDGTTFGKFQQENMCCTYDFEVAAAVGGEAGLKALCERAGRKGVRILSWMAAHLSPRAAVGADKSLGLGGFGVFAARESGRHPDTGYPANCWPLNLNAPVYEWLRKKVLGVCERTGLAGFLWDSVSNLGWWQVDYSSGSMRSQFDRMMRLYAEMVNAGLHIMPEAVATFSNASCCGLHGGNVYEGELLGYSYNTAIGLQYKADGQDRETDPAQEMLLGRRPFDELFQCVAHRRVPPFGFHLLPREEWDGKSAQDIKELLAAYRAVRGAMRRRTVLKDGAGVLWESEAGQRVLFSFKTQTTGVVDGVKWVNAVGGGDAGVPLKANRVYVG